MSTASKRGRKPGPQRRKPAGRNPSPASIRAIPELDPLRAGRRNPFAARIARHGARIVEVPSASSLDDMPEVDFTSVRPRKNPYAERIASAEEIVVRVGLREFHIPVGKGRPAKAKRTGRTTPRSVRFPEEVWRELERRAALRGLTLHAALRRAITEWLGRAA